MDDRTAEFLGHVQSGALVETGDWMPDEYRKRLTKFVEMHANSELMGVLPERDWILRAPTPFSAAWYHGEDPGRGRPCAVVSARVVEDLGKPREACLDDLIAGKSKFHNVFHYPTRTSRATWAIAWLVDAAHDHLAEGALKCSYAPYARIMEDLLEESFHILHGRDVILTLVTGTDGSASSSRRRSTPGSR